MVMDNSMWPLPLSFNYVSCVLVQCVMLLSVIFIYEIYSLVNFILLIITIKISYYLLLRFFYDCQ